MYNYIYNYIYIHVYIYILYNYIKLTIDQHAHEVFYNII